MGQRTLNRLSAAKVTNLTERGYYADGGGLYFRVSAFDTRSWAFRYARAGKPREMGLGAFPDVALKEARERAAEARRPASNVLRRTSASKSTNGRTPSMRRNGIVPWRHMFTL
jgi:hypothetical protein